MSRHQVQDHLESAHMYLPIQAFYSEDVDGHLFAAGESLPTDAGYAKSCQFHLVADDGVDVAGVYVNVGTATTPIWSFLDPGGAAGQTGYSAGGVSKGDMVYISGWNTANGIPAITKADASNFAKFATHVVCEAIAALGTGRIDDSVLLTGLNTSSYSVGDTLYAANAAGAVTTTAPTGNKFQQRVGVVVTAHATTGSIFYAPTMFARVTKFGPGVLQGADDVAYPIGAGPDMNMIWDSANSIFEIKAQTAGGTGFVAIGEHSNVATAGISLEHQTAALKVYADDDGSTGITAASRAIMGRTLLTVNAGDCTMDGVLGQVKINLNVHCSADFSSGVRGYLELKGANTVFTGGANANIGAGGSALRGNISVDTSLTIETGHYLCGLHVGLNTASGVTITQTGKLVGVGVFADDQLGGATPTDKWGIGLFIHQGVTDTAIQIGEQSNTAGSGHLVNNTFKRAVAIFCDDNGVGTGGAEFISTFRGRLLVTGTTCAGEQYAVHGTTKYINSNAGGWSGGILGTMEWATALTVSGGYHGAIFARVGGGAVQPAISAGAYLAGVISATSLASAPTGSGKTAAFLAGATNVGTTDWDYGLKIVDSTCAAGIDIGICTTGITIAVCTTGIIMTGVTGYAIDIVTSGQFRMGVQGTGIPTGTTIPHAVEIHAETGDADMEQQASPNDCGFTAGIRCRYEISENQSAALGFQAIEGRLRVKANMADGVHCGVSGTIESDGAKTFTGTSTTQWSAGNFCIELGASCVFTGASGWVTGITIDSSIHATQTAITNITFPALRIKKSSGKLAWEYGVYIEADSVATGIHVGTCSTAALVLGVAGTDGGDMLVYTDDTASYLQYDTGTGKFYLRGTVSDFQLAASGAASGSGVTLSATKTKAMGVYADDGAAAISTATFIRAGRFRTLMAYLGNREDEAAGLEGQLVSIGGGANRHNKCGLMGTYEYTGSASLTIHGQAAATDAWIQAGVIGRVDMGSAKTTVDLYGVLAGVAAMSITSSFSANSGTYAAFYAGAWSGATDWTHGLYIEAGKCTTAIQTGISGSAGGNVYFYGDIASTYFLYDSDSNRLTLQKTYAGSGDVATYEYAQYIGLSFGTAAQTGKYIAGLKIAMEGSANYDSGTQISPLWIDFQNNGTNSSAGVAHILLQVQAGACMPYSYFRMHSANPGPEFLFLFEQDVRPIAAVGTEGLHGGATKTIKIIIAGTAYFLLASVAPTGS